MRFIGAVFLVLLLSQSAASAATIHDEEYCNENQAQMAECATERADAADAELNQLYKELMSQQAADSKQQLRDAQKAWIVFRDKQCAWEADQFKGGSMRSMIYSDCLRRLTIHRNTYFQTCGEGGCGGPKP